MKPITFYYRIFAAMMLTEDIPRDELPEFEQFLNEYVTEHKRALFKKILAQRTRHISVVLEDLYQPHNASAVLRSCDCFGIQDVHVIENKYEFMVSRGVSIGADKWLSVQHFNQPNKNNTEACFNQLRQNGIRIAATTPHKNDCLISELPLDSKTALVFGSEKDGLSDYALDHADVFVKIPMYGFSESFNISVSAAISLYDVTRRLHESDTHWQLADDEQYLLYIEWLRRSVKYQEALEKHYFESRGLL